MEEVRLRRAPCACQRCSHVCGSEPVLDRAAAWMWSWLPGTGHGTRAYIAQNDKVIAEFRKRLQACMAKVKTVFGVTKARRAKPMPGTPRALYGWWRPNRLTW